jgi:hypothetical protein
MRLKFAIGALAAVWASSGALAQTPARLNSPAMLAASKKVINSPSAAAAAPAAAAARRPRDEEIKRIHKVLDDLRRPRPVSP